MMNRYALLMIGMCLGFHLFGQQEFQYEPYQPIRFKENIQLNGFKEMETYKLSEEELLVVGEKERKSYTYGLRMYFLKRYEDRFRVQFSTHGQGESYIFKPNFFKTSQGHRLIVAEIGAEYAWGAYVYALSDTGMSELGFLNIAGTRDRPPEAYPASIIDQMQIIQEGDSTRFRFRGRVILEPGQMEQKLRTGSKITYLFDGQKLIMKEEE
jgi:hypothetical protein